MNTPTHVLINWSLAKWISGNQFPRRAVLLGSIAPDVPLYLLSIGGALWFGYVEGREPSDVAKHMYANLFYQDTWWISLHNALHSPTVLLIALGIILFRVRESFVRSWWAWFFGSCLVHTLVDIPVHHDDGPLVFWPFNWSYRFSSPFSYWDRNHYGGTVMVLEACIVLGLAAYLLIDYVMRRKAKMPATE